MKPTSMYKADGRDRGLKIEANKQKAIFKQNVKWLTYPEKRAAGLVKPEKRA